MRIMFREDVKRVKACNIYTDSQPAIKVLINPRRQFGQQIIRSTLDNIDTIIKAGMQGIYIPGEHQQIDGNEEADKEAKRALRAPELSSKRFPYHPLNRREKWQSRT
jgi:ribonuclease HI